MTEKVYCNYYLFMAIRSLVNLALLDDHLSQSCSHIIKDESIFQQEKQIKITTKKKLTHQSDRRPFANLFLNADVPIQ